jgi:hypothetical protein
MYFLLQIVLIFEIFFKLLFHELEIVFLYMPDFESYY